VFKSLLAFCLSRRAIVVFGLLLFAGAGLVAFRALDIEAYPNPTPVILEITAQAPGQSAEEMERYYTRPMEIALYTTPGIDVIRSTSFYGLSFVRVVFKYGVDFHFAYAQAAIALQQNVNLPGGVTATIQQNSTTGEIFRYQVVGPKHFGLTNLRTVEDWIVRRRLLTIPGIVQVNSWGGPTKQFAVEVDPHKLEGYNLSLAQVLSALGNANLNVGGREIRVGQQSINIRGVGLIDDGGNDDLTQGYRVEDIENIVLTQSGGVPVQIRNVARVHVGYVPRLGIWGHDDEDDAVSGIVVMNRTEKTADMLPKVKTEIDRMNRDGSLPPGVRLVPIYDRGSLVDITTHTVLHNLAFGCLLVFLIQWVFLGDLRSAILVGVNIPFALLFAIMMLVVRGESANLLSLGAVDFGIIVESAVILVENIFRNFQASPAERQGLLQRLARGDFGPDPTVARQQATTARGWTDRLRLILVSALQVDRAVFFAALIVVAAFVPLFTMQGVEGAIFGPMARTYGYALAGALLATFTVTPVLASLLLPERIVAGETLIVRALHRLYDPVLRFVLAHRAALVAVGMLTLGAAAALVPRLGSEFLPALEEGNFWIRASMPMTLSLEDGEAATHRMRAILGQYPEVVTVFSQHGRPDDGSDASPFSNVELFAVLKPQEQWRPGLTKARLTSEINADLERALPGVNFSFSQYIQDNIQEGISGVKAVNSVKIVGPNLETLTGLAGQVREEMSHIRGVTDLGVFPVLGQPNLDIRIDRSRAARYGLNTGDVNTVIQAATGGASATTVLEGERQFDVAVRYPQEFRDSVRAIGNIRVAAATGGTANVYVPLRELAALTVDTGAAWIYREGNQRFIPVKFSVRGRDLGSTVAEAQQRIAHKVRLPSGYRLIWAGEFGQLQAAKERLAIAVPVSLVLILGLLYTLFNSARECLLALLGIPFVIAGGIFALYFFGLTFSISAAIGFVSLFGVAVMIGILMITTYNQERLLTGSAAAAMRGAATRVMRPLLMMSLSAGIGLLPAALSRGIGSEVQRPLAAVVVGGMLLGSILLLVVVPAFHMLFLRDHSPAGPAVAA
jgi:cobalt-zinc-cadmium resistance protein CzcA